MAALYRLPLVYICENNLYGEYTRQEREMAIVDIADRAAAYGMPGRSVDGMDVLAVYDAVGEAVERARRGEGPSLLECKTYRYYDHVGTSYGEEERPADEREHWRSRDPILLLRERLAADGCCQAATRRASSATCAPRSRRPSSSATRARCRTWRTC
jgi:TPP-dependent pyruvate/acetoin dehydrogenase alpha subunit